jgi:peptide/nickel transport system substrate-binding protein
MSDADQNTHGLSRRGFFGLTAAAGIGVGGLAGCSSSNASSAAVVKRHKDGILRIGVASAPSDINPLDSGSEVTRWLAEPVMESLYTWNNQLKSVPLLADGEPQVSADGLRWTIRVKRGIKFQNGDPLEADDVVASLSRLADLSAGSEWITYMIGYVQRFEKVDQHTVRIVVTRPYGLLRSHLTNLPISHRAFTKNKGAMMGTGPYRLAKFVPGQLFTMTRFEGYHGPKPAFNGIEFRVFQDHNTRLVSLLQGRLDLITALSYNSIGSLKNKSQVKLHIAEAPLDLLSYVLMSREPFSDDNFRKAVAFSSDRAGVLQRVFGGLGTVGQGPIGPGELGWDPSLNVYPAQPDIAKAKALLAAAKTKRRSFTITIGTNQTIKDVAQVLAAGWAKIGLNVKIEPLAGGPWSSKWLSSDYDMLMNTFQTGFTSGPANYLTLTPGDSTNILSCGYKNPVVDRQMASVWSTTEESKRVAALKDINKHLAEDSVIFPPCYPKLVVARRAELSPLDPQQMKISRLSPQTLRFVS